MAQRRSIKLFWHELLLIFKISWKQLLVISVLIWFLMFILNVFLSISLYSNHFSDTLKDKMGMFFYIKDIPWDEHIIYEEILSLKDELESEWLQVEFSSKEDAFQFLQKRVPDVVSSFNKFGIENPLPATLYVMFDDDEEYQLLRETIVEYKNIILNIKDVDEWSTLKQQENRVLMIINFTNFIMVLSYILVGILTLIILVFLTFLLQNIFHRFRHDLSVKKLLWATRWQLVKSFMLLTFVELLMAFVFAFAMVWISVVVINHYVVDLFDVNLFVYIKENLTWLFLVLWIEIVLLMWISLSVSFGFVSQLNKKI